jgi:hypothetical protein
MYIVKWKNVLLSKSQVLYQYFTPICFRESEWFLVKQGLTLHYYSFLMRSMPIFIVTIYYSYAKILLLSFDFTYRWLYSAVPYIFSQNGDVNYLSVKVSTNWPGYCNVNEKGTYLIFQYLVICHFAISGLHTDHTVEKRQPHSHSFLATTEPWSQYHRKCLADT